MAGREPVSYTGINSIGLSRRGFDNETIYAIQEVYRIIYQRGLNISDALSLWKPTFRLPGNGMRSSSLYGNQKEELSGVTSTMKSS